MGNLGVGNDDWLGDRIGHRAQAGAEDDADWGASGPSLALQERGGFRDLVVVSHG